MGSLSGDHIVAVGASHAVDGLSAHFWGVVGGLLMGESNGGVW